MNATLAPTIEEIEKWSPAQQVETLARLARLVMDRQPTKLLRLPSGGAAHIEAGDLVLSESPRFTVRTSTPAPDDHDLIELNRLACDPRNCLPFDGIVDDLIDLD